MSQRCLHPESLHLVKSTLEMAMQMRTLYPTSEPSLSEIEVQVKNGGQMLLEAGSDARARLALETIHGARLKLQEVVLKQTEFTA